MRWFAQEKMRPYTASANEGEDILIIAAILGEGT